MDRGNDLLRKFAAVDIHSHPGRFFVEGADPDLPLAKVIGPPRVSETLADMAAGGVAAALFSTVTDMAVLGMAGPGRISAVRDPEPGELYGDHQRQMGTMKQLMSTGGLMPVRRAADIVRAHEARKIGAIFSTEGGDFLEGRLERLAQAHEDGIRAMTIVHYRVNEIGDIQTGAPRHGGLSKFGRQVIKEMNRLGILVDLAHAHIDTVKNAVAVSEKPVILSHSRLRMPGVSYPRFLGPEHARLIAETGGVIGAWPAGIGISSLDEFLDEIMRLVEAVGVDHVGIGSDMDGNYKPVFKNYRELPLIAAGLLERGLAEQDAAKVLGGNFMRVFEAVAG